MEFVVRGQGGAKRFVVRSLETAFLAGLLGALLLSLFGCVDSLERINALVNVANKAFHPKNYTRNLVEEARTGAFNNVVERKDLFQLLRRQIQQNKNTLITGLTGVGKTQLVNQLAREIAQGRAGPLDGMKDFRLQLGRAQGSVSGTGHGDTGDLAFDP
ncbi:MAG: hypothetical protein AAF471_02430 [Myxococcota bacterium]